MNGQQAFRVEAAVEPAHAPMQVRPGRPPALPHQADRRPRRQPLPDLDVDPAQSIISLANLTSSQEKLNNSLGQIRDKLQEKGFVFGPTETGNFFSTVP